MNHIADNQQAQTILGAVHGGKWSIVHYFFDFRARDGIANNMEGLVRSVLVQLIEAKTTAIPASIETKLTSQISRVQKMSGAVSIAYSVCRKAVLAMFEASNGVLLLLDGLDEFAGSKVELLTFLNDACIAMEKSKSSKICLASRPETKDGSKFTEVPGMLMQNVNQKAIEQYARYCFSVVSGYDTREEEYGKLARKLSDHANGVFLWAYHAVGAVTDGITEGKDLPVSLEARLNNFPKELGEIYTRIFTKIIADPEKRQFCTITLLLLTSGEADLTLATLFSAMKNLPNNDELCGTFSTSINYLSEVEYRRRLFASCPGLIDVYDDLLSLADSPTMRWGLRRGDPGFTTSFVRTTHRTVSEHLESVGWQQLQQAHPKALAHELWLYSSLQTVQENRGYLDSLIDFDFIRGDKSTDPWCVGPEIDHMRAKAGSLYYMVGHFLSHAAAFERLSQQSSYPIFESFNIMRLAHYHLVFHCNANLNDWDYACCSPHEYEIFREFGELIHLAMNHSLQLYVKDYLTYEGDRRPTRSEMRLKYPGRHRFFSSARESRTVKDMVRHWAIESTAISWWRYHEAAVSIQMLRDVLSLTPRPTTREIVTAIILCPIEVGLTLLHSYKANEPSDNEEELSDFVYDVQYHEFLSCLSMPSSVLLWSLGKRLWHNTGHISLSHCKSAQASFDELYETIARAYSLDQNAIQMVLLSFVDGDLPWVTHGLNCRMVRNASTCSLCCTAILRSYLMRCTKFDLVGPHGNLLESAWYYMLAGTQYSDGLYRLGKIYIDLCEMMLDTAMKTKQADSDSTAPSTSHMPAYIWILTWLRGESDHEALTRTGLATAHATNAYAIIQPYFQTLYRTSPTPLEGEGKSSVMQVAQRHITIALRQARGELLSGDRYTAGPWKFSLYVTGFDELVHALLFRDILGLEEANSLFI